MMWLKAFLAVLILVIPLFATAQQGSLRVSWPEWDEAKGYAVVYWNASGLEGRTEKVYIDVGNEDTYTFEDLPYGRWCFVVRIFWKDETREPWVIQNPSSNCITLEPTSREVRIKEKGKMLDKKFRLRVKE